MRQSQPRQGLRPKCSTLFLPAKGPKPTKYQTRHSKMWSRLNNHHCQRQRGYSLHAKLRTLLRATSKTTLPSTIYNAPKKGPRTRPMRLPNNTRKYRFQQTMYKRPRDQRRQPSIYFRPSLRFSKTYHRGNDEFLQLRHYKQIPSYDYARLSRTIKVLPTRSPT